MTFDDWMGRVDARLIRLTGGLDADSLGAEGMSPSLRDAFDSGTSPAEYASDLLAHSGFPVPAPAPAPAPAPRPAPAPTADDAATLRAEAVRRANWTPSRTVRNGRWTETRYVPGNAAVEAALRTRRSTGRLPRLY